MAIPQIQKTLTGLIGEFSVAVKLCQMKYYPSLTLKNYPDVDIFVANPLNDKKTSIQVKSLRKKNGKSFYVPKNIDTLKCVFIFAYIVEDNLIEYYIVPAKEVAIRSIKEREDYIKSHPNVNPIQPRMISIVNIAEFKDKWKNLELD